MLDRIAECRSCHARIVWGTTRNGERIPLDAEPALDGNALLNSDKTVDVLGPIELACHDRDVEPLRMPHFATCPHGKEWSRR